jgi:hypothetical protein
MDTMMTELEKALSAELEASRQNEKRLTAKLARANDLIEDLRAKLAMISNGYTTMVLNEFK